MTAKPCEFCGDPLDGMRADARFHPECKDADRRERERPSQLRDRLLRELGDLLVEGDRLLERAGEMLDRQAEVHRAVRGVRKALEEIEPKPSKGFWALLAEIWDPSLRDERSDPAKGRAGAQTRCTATWSGSGKPIRCEEPDGHGGTHHRGQDGNDPYVWANEDSD